MSGGAAISFPRYQLIMSSSKGHRVEHYACIDKHRCYCDARDRVSSRTQSA
jgi:hypothetical protein